MRPVLEHISILGVRLDIISLEELIDYALRQIQNGNKSIISNVNVHAINIACEQNWFKEFINRAEIVFCDGFGVKWAARFLYGVEIQRYTPPDWFDRLALRCANEGISMFFLGTRQEVVEKAANLLRTRYPRLKILGAQHGFFNKEPDSAENLAVLAEINALKPDILVVGFGMPTQEKWLLENWPKLNALVALPVGAFFDYLTGDVVRAPRWMTDHGLEWLGRLLVEPHRLWKRYILGNPLFIWRVVLQKFKIRNYN